MKKLIIWLAGVGYATIFGFSFLMTKGALDVLSPPELMFMRFSVAALLMSLLWIFRVIRLDYSHAHIGHLVLTCLFQPILYFLCETYGVRESTSSMAGIVIGAIPASVAFLGTIMLGEKLGTGQKFCLALSIAGVAFIVISGGGTDGGGGTVLGFILLLGAVAAASLFNIYSRKTSKGLRPLETTFAMMWTGAVFFGFMNLVSRFSGLGSWTGATATAASTATVATGSAAVDFLAGGGSGGLIARAFSAWPSLLYLGVMSSVVAFFLINFTLSRLAASQSAVFTNLTTLVSVAAGVLIRHEPFGPVQLLGAAMIVVGVWGTNALGSGGKPEGRADPEAVSIPGRMQERNGKKL